MGENEKQLYITSLAFFTSCLLICIIIFLIYSFGNNTLNEEHLLNKYALSLGDFLAENTEKYSYIISAITYPIIFLLSYIFLKKHIKTFSERKLKIITCTEIILGITAVSVFTAFSEITRDVYYPKFSNIIIPVFALIFFTFLLILYNRSTKVAKVINFLAIIVIFAYITLIFTIYHTPTYDISLADVNHFEAYFYPIYKTLSGMTPGVDFNNIYGFYPLIYSLFFNMD